MPDHPPLPGPDRPAYAYPHQVVDSILALRAVGITSETDGDYTMSTLRVSVND